MTDYKDHVAGSLFVADHMIERRSGANAVAASAENKWAELKVKTSENIAAGSKTMAVLWESAWKHGAGINYRPEN